MKISQRTGVTINETVLKHPAMSTFRRENNNEDQTHSLVDEACRTLNNTSNILARELLPLIKNIRRDDFDHRGSIAVAAFLSRLLQNLTGTSTSKSYSDTRIATKKREELLSTASYEQVSLSKMDKSSPHHKLDSPSSSQKRREESSYEYTIDENKNYSKQEPPQVNSVLADQTNKVEPPSSVFRPGLITDLARLLHVLDTAPHNQSQSGVATGIETAFDVIKMCSTHLYTSSNIDIIYEIALRNCSSSSFSTPINENSKFTRDEKEQLHRTFCLTLELMIQECHSIVKLKSTFDKMWESFACSRKHIGTGTYSEALKRAAWLLQAITSIYERCEALSNNNTTEISNKNRLRVMAACVTLVVQTTSEDYDNRTSDAKKMRLNDDKLYSSVERQRQCPTIEEEAIDALTIIGSPSKLLNEKKSYLETITAFIDDMTVDDLQSEIERVGALIVGRFSMARGGSPNMKLSSQIILSDEDKLVSVSNMSKETITNVNEDLASDRGKGSPKRSQSEVSSLMSLMTSFFCTDDVLKENIMRLERQYHSVVSHLSRIIYRDHGSSPDNALGIRIKAGQETIYAAVAVDEVLVVTDKYILGNIAQEKSQVTVTGAIAPATPVKITAAPQCQPEEQSKTMSPPPLEPNSNSNDGLFTRTPVPLVPTPLRSFLPPSNHNNVNINPSTPRSHHSQFSPPNFSNIFNEPHDEAQTATSPVPNLTRTPTPRHHRNGGFNTNPSPPFISSPLSIYDSVMQSPARNTIEWQHISPSTPQQQSHNQHQPSNSSYAYMDWINRLCTDPTLSRPSWRLMMYFQSSETSAYAFKENPNALWGSVVSTLNVVLQRLAVALVEQEQRDANIVGSDKQRSCGTVELLATGELLLRQANHPSDYHSGKMLETRKRVLIASLSLYYNALESLLALETSRLSTISHPKLLKNSVFHRALMAACVECVLNGLSVSSLTYPDVLHAMGIDAYDFLKVTECFVRALCSPPPTRQNRTAAQNGGLNNLMNDATPCNSSDAVHRPLGLPVGLRRHLKACEEQILESLLWKKPRVERGQEEGGMFAALSVLKKNRHHPGAMIYWPPIFLREEEEDINIVANIGDEAERASSSRRITSSPIASDTNQDNNNNTQIINSPRSAAQHIGTVIVSPHSEGQLRQFQISTNFVLRKLLTLSARRIHQLCVSLNLIVPVIERIWIAWKYLLNHHIELLYDRHVDQLILCTIYGVCKIIKFEPEVTFRATIDAYYDMNSSKDEKVNDLIIRYVNLNDSQHGNVINMYNVVYVPAMQKHLLQNQGFLEKIRQDAAERSAVIDSTAKVAKGKNRDMLSSSSHLQYPYSPGSAGGVNMHDINCLPSGMINSLHSLTPHQVGANVFVNTIPSNRDEGSVNVPRVRINNGKFVLSPKTRSLYNFGSSGGGDLARINSTIQSAAAANALAGGKGSEGNNTNGGVIPEEKEKSKFTLHRRK